MENQEKFDPTTAVASFILLDSMEFDGAEVKEKLKKTGDYRE